MNKESTKKKKIFFVCASAIAAMGTAAFVMKRKAKKTTYQASDVETIPTRKKGFYEKYIKRAMDVICASAAIVVFSPLYITVVGLVKIKLGSPVLFTQDRPGMIDKDGKETVFKMYKFRTMTDERDEEGNLLPDDVRLTKFGAWLRSTSLDELPEAFNILNGTMSVIGPRPQLVRDMTFMTKEQRARHTAKPGLSGLAQINGRNAITWEDKLGWDLKYIQKISFLGDIRIILKTVEKAFVKQEGITEDDMATAEDFGDYLLRTGNVDQEEYDLKQAQAKEILGNMSHCNKEENGTQDENVQDENSQDADIDVAEDARNGKYSVLMSLYKKENPDYLRLALDSMLGQTVPPNEIVLVEDGPLTDELYAVLDEYDAHLHRVKNETNLGLGLALNVGLKECRNELVARMDTDDISKPDRCEKQLKKFKENPELSLVGAFVDEFYSTPNEVVSTRKVPTEHKDIYEFAKRRSAFNHPAVMYRESKVLGVGGYSDLRRNQDVDLFGRMLYSGCIAANCDESLLWFRSNDDLAKRRKSWENTWSYIDTIRRFWKMGYSGFSDFTIIAVAQTGMFMCPAKLQHWVYKKFLRG